MWRALGSLMLFLAVTPGCADWITDIPPFARVDVTAMRRSGDPVPGAPVTLYIGERIMGKGLTGEDGSYRFDYLPTNQYGVYAEPPDGYVRPEVLLGGPTTSSTTDGLNLPEGGRASVSFTYLKVGPGAIEAELVDPAGGALPHVDVVLYNSSGLVTRGTTNQSGKVRFDPTPFGIWGVRFEVPRQFVDPDQPVLFRDGLVVEDGTDINFVYTAPLCEGEVRVTVGDASSRPVAGYPTQLFNDRGQTFESMTGSDGSLAFNPVYCGNYGVRLLRAPGWSFAEGRGTEFIDGLVILSGDVRSVSFTVTAS